jgi:hypothetical protein
MANGDEIGFLSHSHLQLLDGECGANLGWEFSVPRELVGLLPDTRVDFGGQL